MLLISMALAGAALAQEVSQFDVASIMPNTSLRKGYSVNTDKHGEFIAESVTLRNLISYAYRVKEFQILGGDKWVDSEHYDVFAKPPDASDPADATARLRLRALLAERFQLAVHTESRDLAVYLLTVAKKGPRLDPAKQEDKWTGIEGKRGR